MKKWGCILCAALLMLGVLGGCVFQTADYAFDLGKQPVVEDQAIKLNSHGSVSLFFQVPADGVVQLWADDGFTATLKDEKGYVLYENASLSEDPERVYAVTAGTLVVTVTAKNAAEAASTVALSWTYTPEG